MSVNEGAMLMGAVEDALVGQAEELPSEITGAAAGTAAEATAAATADAATAGSSEADALFQRESATSTAASTTKAKAATTEAVSITTNTGTLSGAHPVMAVPLTAGVVVAGYGVYNVNRAANKVGGELDRGARAVGDGLSAFAKYTRDALASVHPPDLSNLSKEAQEELKQLKAAASKAAGPVVTNLKWFLPVTVSVVIIGMAVVLYHNITVDV